MSAETPKKDVKATTPTSTTTAAKTVPIQPTQIWLYATIGCISSIVVFFIGIWLLPTPHYKTGFRTLSELQTHAATIDEWIKMENDNELLPSYENYYKNTFKRTTWYRWKEKCVWLFSRLHIIKQPPFSSPFFATVLENVLQSRLQKGWTGDLIQKLEIKPTSKLVVFGVTQGAFHSVVRDLEQLKKLNIIDENLKLKRPDYYMIFLGNVVNRSPYTLDTFAIMLRLLQENPENIVYLRGTNEFFDYWKDHTLKRELELRCGHLSSEKIPLCESVNKFFDTLPITLYTTMPSWPTENLLNYVRFAAFIGDKRLLGMLDESTYAKFLLTPSTSALETFDLNKRATEPQPESNQLLLRAVIKDILKRDFFEPTEGLSLLSPVDGVIAWNVISAPTEPYQHMYNFFNDAFALILPNSDLNQFLIKLYSRNVKDVKNQLAENKNYLFLLGEKIELLR